MTKKKIYEILDDVEKNFCSCIGSTKCNTHRIIADIRNQVKRAGEAVKMDQSHCKGCRNNFYNGNNPLEIKKCWSLETAEFVERIAIGVNERPPYLNKEKIMKPKCYHQDGMVYVDPKVLTPAGYWR